MPRVVTHKNPNTIWLFDYPSLASMATCKEIIVCLSERELNIIYQSTKDIDRWSTRLFTDKQGTSYTIAEPEEFEEFQGWVSDLRISLGDYNVCNELLERIAEALETMNANASATSNSSGGCGCGSRGTGSSAIPPNPWDVEDNPETPPDGFEDMEEFNNHRCRVAGRAIDDLISDFNSISVTSIVGVLFTAFASLIGAVLLTPVPFDDLLIIAAALITGGLAASYLSTMASTMVTNREELVCILATAPSSSEAQSLLEGRLQELAADFVIGEFDEGLINQVIDAMVTSDLTNRLFEPGEQWENEDEDCSGCGEEEEFIIEIYDPGPGNGAYGVMTPDGENRWIIDSEFGDSAHRINWHAVDGVGAALSVTVIEVRESGANHDFTHENYYLPCGAGSFVGPMSDISIANEYEGDCIHAMALASTTSFSITLEVSEVCTC